MPDATESAPASPGPTAGRLIDAWAAERLARGYTRESVVTSRKWVRAAAAGLDLLTCAPADTADWLAGHEWTANTRRTVVAALRGYAGWLVAHHHRPDSFLDAEPPADRDSELLTAWTQSMRAAGRAATTIDRRTYHLRRFAAAAGCDLASASAGDCEAWLAGNPQWEPETRKSALGSLRGFYRWAHRHGHIPEDPTALLDPVRVPEPDTRAVPDDVLAQALAAADSPETRLMLRLAAHGGLRRAEIARVHSADLHGDVLTVLGKGRKRRRVPLGADLAEQIRRCEGWVFPSPSRPGEPIEPDQVGRRLSELLGPGWTGHGLRHRYATRAYRGTKDLLAVQRLLGHANPNTTRRYVVTDDDALAAAAAAGRGDEATPAAPAAPALRLIDGEGGAA